MQFLVTHKDPHSQARVGLITTHKGNIRTPTFILVGTIGSVKSVPQQVLQDQIDADIILGNTYRLYLRPGIKLLAGGLHSFMGWHRSILTDSGGYQVYSLANNRKLTEA